MPRPLYLGIRPGSHCIWQNVDSINVKLENQAPNTTGSNHLYNTLELLMMGIMMTEACWANNKICNKNSSVAPSWHFISTYQQICVSLMILYVLKVLEDGTPVPKHVEVIIIMSCGSWFVLYCTVFTGYVGRYIEYTKLHGMSRRNRKIVFFIFTNCNISNWAHCY